MSRCTDEQCVRWSSANAPALCVVSHRRGTQPVSGLSPPSPWRADCILGRSPNVTWGFSSEPRAPGMETSSQRHKDRTSLIVESVAAVTTQFSLSPGQVGSECRTVDTEALESSGSGRGGSGSSAEQGQLPVQLQAAPLALKAGPRVHLSGTRSRPALVPGQLRAQPRASSVQSRPWCFSLCPPPPISLDRRRPQSGRPT